MRKPFTKFVLAAVMGASFMLGVDTAQAASAAANHPQVKVNFYTSSFGSANYTASFALGDLLNKKHPWLRASVMETTQAADAIKTVANDPALTKNSIFPIASSVHYDLVNGQGSFKGKPLAYKALAMYNSNAVAFCALDPKIQTMQDLNGKRLSIGSAGGAAPPIEALIAAYGIKPSKVEKISWEPGKDALVDGKVDACAQTLGDTSVVPYMPPATIQQLLTQKGFHIVAMDREGIKKAAETQLLGFVELPAGILNLTKPVITSLNFNTWAGCPDLDPEIAYELVKFIAENAKEFAGYDKSLASVKRETLAAIVTPVMTLHPSAEKYYKEQKIRIGQ
jgi:TRAP transporter TAXI family solute receptor